MTALYVPVILITQETFQKHEARKGYDHQLLRQEEISLSVLPVVETSYDQMKSLFSFDSPSLGQKLFGIKLLLSS